MNLIFNKRREEGAKTHWDRRALLARRALYYLAIGQRSNGKSYGYLEECLEDFVKNGRQFAYVRRIRPEIVQANGLQVFSGLVANGVVADLTNGQWTDVFYYARKFYFCRYDEETGKREQSDEPIGFAFALSDCYQYKSSNYPQVGTIFFDEFVARSQYDYLIDEFDLFQNLISTIVRDRNDVRIFMAGNSIDIHCPYWRWMGLTEIKKMEIGQIDMYEYPAQPGLVVAVQMTDRNGSGKPDSSVYFGFGDQKAEMITGDSVWAIERYPHCPGSYDRQTDVLFTYYIRYDGTTVKCDIIYNEKLGAFTFIHRAKPEEADEDNDLIFSDTYSPRLNWRRRITRPQDDIGGKIWKHFVNETVFYQSDDIGELVAAYIAFSKQ